VAKRVGCRGETHAWLDGEHWHLYSERPADIRRFTLWFGPPSRRGREGACAHWDELPMDAVRVRKKHKRAPAAAPSASSRALPAGRKKSEVRT